MISKILNQLNSSVHQDFNFDRPGGRYEISHYCLVGVLVLVAFYLRIVNLGVPGLSGDEDIMGLAVRGLHETGQSVMPSGMEYRRAILHTYILYYSTLLFGQTEWALRIPSVIAGMLLLIYVFQVGKRFLEPMTNVAAFSLFALAPPLIEISRTARMYVFLVLLLAVFIHFIFKWEREENYINPFFALFFLCIAATFHSLAIFALPVILWPAISTGSARRLTVAIAACIPFLVFYWYFGNWVGAPYPSLEEQPIYVEAARPSLKYINTGSLDWLRWAFGLLATVWLAWMARKHSVIFKNLRVAILACGLLLVLCRYYLPGMYVIVVGALWRRRIGEIVDRPVAISSSIALLVFAIDLVGSFAQAGMNRIAVRTAFEQASPYFWIRTFETFPVPALVVVTMTPFLVMQWRLKPKPPGFAFLVLFALLLPMFAMSTFRWDFASRYLFAFLPLLFIMTAALLQEAAQRCNPQLPQSQRQLGTTIAAALIILTMHPKALYQFARGDTSEMPAHKATANFVAKRPDFEQAVIVAEGSIATHYYLGRLDYRLQYGPQAAKHARVQGGRIEDQYTGAEIIGSGPELRQLLCSSKGTVYVIGDGQVSKSLRNRNRQGGIGDILQGSLVTPIYELLPGPATVWRQNGSCLPARKTDQGSADQ